MKLTHIKIENFKSIKNLDLELKNINILLGANGAGKSNFISFFKMLNSFVEKNFQTFIKKEGGAESILYFGSKNSSYLKGEMYFGRNKYSFRLVPDNQNSLFFEWEMVSFRKDSGHWKDTIINKNQYESFLEEASQGIEGRWTKEGIPFYVFKAMKKWRVYHFHDTSYNSPLRKSSKVKDNKFLRNDGANLSSFLYLLKEKYPQNFYQIERTFRKIAPFFEKFELEPDRFNSDWIELEWLYKDSDGYFNASQLSDGSLRMLSLLTVLLQPDNFLPSVILIDEPELGLHPAAIYLLSEVIKKTALKTQIILSSQSPSLISYFVPKDVIVVDVEERTSKFKRIEENNFRDWLEDYSLGQLWEKNIIGGRP